jgi:hypothetical protein
MLLVIVALTSRGQHPSGLPARISELAAPAALLEL